MRRLIGLVFILFLTTSCKHKTFLEFENDGAILQILVRPDHVLKAVNVGDEGGARMLQLFDKSFNLIEEVSINNIRCEVSEWDNKVVEIKFYVSDLPHFLPWFNQNAFKPQKIGGYNIRYTYVEEKGGRSRDVTDVDSVNLDKQNLMVSLFHEKRLLRKVRLDSLSICSDQIEFDDGNNNLVYSPKDKAAINKFMESIISIYQ